LYISTASNAESIDASRIDFVFPLRNFNLVPYTYNASITGEALLRPAPKARSLLTCYIASIATHCF
jgi:hypothetical protein